MAYNTFISWSGAATMSKAAALLLREWLPDVIQAAAPFMSDKDIDAGARGLEEIDAQLEDLRIGIICVTAENQSAAWINYEAGALGKTIGKSYVIPLALDIDKGQIKQPLGRFQAKLPTEEDVEQLVTTINKALGRPLTEVQLARAFQRAWPEFNTRMTKIRSEHAQQSFEEAEPKRSVEDMLEEVIVAVRDQSRLLSGVRNSNVLPTAMNVQLKATEMALLKLGRAYGLDRMMNLRELRERTDFFDNEDWKTIETSPFLVWYLDSYFGLRRPTLSESHQQGSLDDVPF